MSPRLFILLSAATLLCVHGTYVPNNESFLKRIGIDSRIFGGMDTPIEKTPYQVSLQVNGKHNCGGVIFSTKIIITAAHCLYKLHAKDLSIRAGSSTWNSGGSLIRVSEISVHEQYSSVTVLNDIALLLLSRPLKLGNRVQTISLASSEPEDGAIAIASGWGITESEEQPLHLKSVNVHIVSREECSQAYKDKTNVNIFEEMICAAAPGKDACSKDSGGPLVHNEELVGIVSFGIRVSRKSCTDPKYPGVYVNVAKLHKWIVETANKLLSKEQK